MIFYQSDELKKEKCADGDTKKRGPADFSSSPLIGGDYLRLPVSQTTGVVRLNFSVRNGKRWDPHAIITLVSFSGRPPG